MYYENGLKDIHVATYNYILVNIIKENSATDHRYHCYYYGCWCNYLTLYSYLPLHWVISTSVCVCIVENQHRPLYVNKPLSLFKTDTFL